MVENLYGWSIGTKSLSNNVRKFEREVWNFRAGNPGEFRNIPVSLSLTLWFRWLVDCWLIQGRGCFFPLYMAPSRPRQDGERAWPLAKMLLGAKHGGRPPIVSRIIVHEYCALWVFPDCSTAKFYLLSLKNSTNDGLKSKKSAAM